MVKNLLIMSFPSMILCLIERSPFQDISTREALQYCHKAYHYQKNNQQILLPQLITRKQTCNAISCEVQHKHHIPSQIRMEDSLQAISQLRITMHQNKTALQTVMSCMSLISYDIADSEVFPPKRGGSTRNP